jgi:hypothetical protein
MIHQPKPESIIEELHRIRREISDRFGGDIAAIAKDAADRLAKSGRPIWKPQPETPASQGPGDRSQSPASPVTARR